MGLRSRVYRQLRLVTSTRPARTAGKGWIEGHYLASRFAIPGREKDENGLDQLAHRLQLGAAPIQKLGGFMPPLILHLRLSCRRMH